MKRYEVAIKVLDPAYVDQLLVGLARQGLEVYLVVEDITNIRLCFGTTDDEVTEIRETK